MARPHNPAKKIQRIEQLAKEASRAVRETSKQESKRAVLKAIDTLRDEGVKITDQEAAKAIFKATGESVKPDVVRCQMRTMQERKGW